MANECTEAGRRTLAEVKHFAYVGGMAWSSPPPIFDHEDERALKLDFARRWALNPHRILSIGYEVFPGEENYGRAMQAQAWRHDPIVIAEYERLHGGEAALTGEESEKAEMIRRIKEFQLECNDPKVKLDALKLEADIKGLTPKGGTNVNVVNDNSVVRNVLLVPQYKSREDFAVEFKQQQTRLLADARSQR